MDLLKEVYDLKETVGHKIAQANKKIRSNGGDIENDDVDIVDKLSHSIKSLVTTCAMLEAEVVGGYSGRYARAYNPGITYAREGHDGYSRENRNGYSRTGSMTEQLRQMMDEAPDEMTRMEIRKLMDKMDQR